MDAIDDDTRPILTCWSDLDHSLWLGCSILGTLCHVDTRWLYDSVTAFKASRYINIGVASTNGDRRVQAHELLQLRAAAKETDS